MDRYLSITMCLFALNLTGCFATDTSEPIDLRTETYKINDELAQRAALDIVALQAQHGGSTYHLEDGNLLGTKGYAVAVYPERSVTITHSLAIEDVKAFILANQDLLNKGWHAIGTWYDKKTNHTVLDIVSTPSDRNAAIAIGARAKQEYIYDLSHSALVPTGYAPKMVSKNIPSDN